MCSGRFAQVTLRHALVLTGLLLGAACGGRASSLAQGETSGARSGGSSPSGASAGIAIGDQGENGPAPDAGVRAADIPNADAGSKSGTENVGAVEAGTDATIEIREASADVESGGGPEPPSCAPGGPGMTNCGPGGSGTESCCTSLDVQGGTYYRTFNIDDSTSAPPDGGWADQADPTIVSSFRLDKYDVTVGRFRQFAAAWSNGYTPPTGSGKHTHLNGGAGLVDVGAGASAGTVYETGWLASDNQNIDPTYNLSTCAPYSTWTSEPGAQENLPINCVNWDEAYAFCIWDVGFLPSEAEWEYAAAGGSQQRLFPWGSMAPGTANQYAIYGCCYPGGSGSCDPIFGCSGLVNFAPVGTAAMGAGRWGQLDLSGDVWEWTLDFATQSYVDPCTDCAYLTPPLEGYGDQRQWRGAYCGSPASELLVADDYGTEEQSGRHFYLGFRCARTP
jgi:formylglycine-generating enzyme